MQITKSESRAESVALAHIKAWSNHKYDEARKYLSDDVHVSVTTTQPTMPATDTVGIEKYMEGLTKFGQVLVPGSSKIIGSMGDEQNALVMVSIETNLGPNGSRLPLAGARLYALDEKGKIKAERVVFCLLSR